MQNQRDGEGQCNGGFGELIQGMLPGDRPFLVNLPLASISVARVRIGGGSSGIPDDCRKSAAVVRSALAAVGKDSDFSLEISSQLPIGKGLSSSTADMIAAVRAVEDALDQRFEPDQIGRMLTDIEPNDGLHFSGTSAYLHTAGVLIERTDWIPPFAILGIDTGGEVDTLQFNANRRVWTDEQLERFKVRLDELLDALRRRDLQAIGAVATVSTRAWQAVYPKGHFDEITALAEETGAVGIVNAHSGTYLGLLYMSEGEAAAAEQRAQAFVPNLETRRFRTLGLAGVDATAPFCRVHRSDG